MITPWPFISHLGSLRIFLDYKERPFATLKVSNVLWPNKGFSILKSFKDTLAEGYRADPVELDFTHAPNEATKIINETIAKQTNNEIKELLKETLLPDTRLVLTNALYFKSDWLKPFEEEDTKVENFTKKDGVKIRTPLMKQTGDFNYGEDEVKQFLLLPYKDKDFATLIVLPKLGQFKAIEKSLSYDGFEDMMKKVDSAKKVNLWLPKFSARTTPAIKDALERRGISALFDEGRANLTGIAENKDLFVSDIAHEAVVKIFETGTIAAAASAVMIKESMAMPPKKPEDIIKFHADRPFFYFILYKPSNTILFMGRVDEPSTKEL